MRSYWVTAVAFAALVPFATSCATMPMPCGGVTFRTESTELPAPNVRIEHVVATVTMPNSAPLRERFPYPWTYTNADQTDPWSPTQTRLRNEARILEFKIIPAAVHKRALADKKYAADPAGAYKDSGPAVYSGTGLMNAMVTIGATGVYSVEFRTLDPRRFAAMTQKNVGKQLGMFYNKKLVSDATLYGIIAETGVLSLPNTTYDDAKRIAKSINDGTHTTGLENDEVRLMTPPPGFYANSYSIPLHVQYLIDHSTPDGRINIPPCPVYTRRPAVSH